MKYLKKRIDDTEKFWEKNTIKINKFKEKYISKYYKEVEGIAIETNINHLKKDDEPVRNLTQVSYRLWILFYMLMFFFAGLFTKEKKNKYLLWNMNWNELITECWELLKLN